MIFGIGIDSVEIDRISKSMQRPHFTQRVFSPAEQELIASLEGRRACETAAACFAAKEALLKATGQGLGGFGLSEVSALRKESGQPYYEFAGAAAAFMLQRDLSAHLSITHTGALATAFAVLEVRRP